MERSDAQRSSINARLGALCRAFGVTEVPGQEFEPLGMDWQSDLIQHHFEERRHQPEPPSSSDSSQVPPEWRYLIE